MRQLSYLFLILIACKSDPKPADNPSTRTGSATIEGSAAPAGSGAPAAPAGSAGSAATAASPATAVSAEQLDAFIANLVGIKGVAGYSTSENTTVWDASAMIEGDAYYRHIVFKKGDGPAEALTIVGDALDPDPKWVADVRQRIVGKDYVPYSTKTQTKWQSGKKLADIAVPGRPGKLRWQDSTLSYVAADGTVAASKRLTPSKGIKIDPPDDIYTAEGRDIILVKSWYRGPDGFNQEVDALAIPAGK